MLKPPKALRNPIAIVHDAVMAALSFLLALQMRWGDAMWRHAQDYWLQGALLCALSMLTLTLASRSYRGLWRYVSLRDIANVTKIATATLLLFYLLMFMNTRLEMLPRSVPVIQWLVLLALLCAPRFAYRALHERRLQLPRDQQVPVLLIGATAEAELFIRESMRSPSFTYRVVGLVATDAAMVGRSIHHVRVYGRLDELETILRKLRRKDIPPQRLIIADAHLEGVQVRDVLRIAEAHGTPLARMPQITDLTRSDKSKFDIQPIAVEDILGRPQAALDMQAIRNLVSGQVVLITGAGGSIGSELVRQVAGFGPRRLILFEQGEYNLYAIDRELAERFPDLPRKAIMADVREAQYTRQIFAVEQPDVVFHAAALKHVPLSEINAEEAILTNIIGTRNVCDACVYAKVKLMVQISTDKAVNPTNVMGACKRVGESYAQALGQDQKTTRFITVRFGNVLGSTGSVVPLFEHQLRRGGPLTVTHTDMTRYFMTIREAVQLVLQAAVLGQNEDQAAPIYVLDMGEPVRIDDLARQMIRLAGLRPDIDVQIAYTGLRPGEKLHEELFYGTEALLKTPHSSIQLAQARDVALKPLAKKLDQLEKTAQKRERTAALAALRELVPEYQPTP